MNIREYVENPMGKGDSSIPNRKELIESLNLKYEKLIREKDKDLKMVIYRDLKNDEYYFHLTIPSESERSNSYDVVFLFYDDKEHSHHGELSIANYNVKVFSNSPSFAYTFAYVYADNGLMIDSLRSKLGKEFFKKAPEVRNRFGIINYEKYIYFGAKYILDSKRLNRAFADMGARPYVGTSFNHNIRTLETIMKEYHNAEAQLRRKKKRESLKANARTLGDHNSITPKSSIGKQNTVKVAKKKDPKKNRVKYVSKR